MTALVDPTNLKLPAFETGDAGIILKADGSFQLWNTLDKPSAETLTPRQIEQGEILMAFSAALKLPPLMSVLKQVANDPEVFDQIIDTGRKQ